MKTMTAQQITDALARATSSTELTRLLQACDPRRVELRARMAAISAVGHPVFPDPPERQAAQLKGLDALAALDRELDTLERESASFDRLEQAIVDAREKAIDAEARRDIPIAQKRLPKLMTDVRTKLAALDSAIAELRTAVVTIGDYTRLPDKALPLSDRELTELLQLRAEVWGASEVTVLQPPAGYKQSAALFFEHRSNGVFFVRRPGPHLPDYATEGR